jgi:hypothetical protein
MDAPMKGSETGPSARERFEPIDGEHAGCSGREEY